MPTILITSSVPSILVSNRSALCRVIAHAHTGVFRRLGSDLLRCRHAERPELLTSP